MSDSDVCILCGRKFTAKKNLYSHYRGVHKVQPRTRATIQCPQEGCRFKCNFVANLRIHVENAHSTTMEKEILLFHSPEEFLEWKTKEEKETKSSFVQNCGAKRTKDGTERITYVCHRSGKFHSSSTGKRLLKSQGSIKLGSHCTAAIELHREESGTCTVIYFKTHFGHEQHIGLLQLSRSDREAIARQIAEGVPFEKILNDVKSSIHSREPERIHLITRRDLHNIKRGKIAKGVAFEKILEDIKSSIHSGEPERLHLITRHDLHNIKRDFGIGGTLEQDINEESGQNERLDANAFQSRRLENKLQVLKSRIRSSLVSRETKCKVEKEVDYLLSLTESDLKEEVSHKPNHENLKVLRMPDKSNTQREVLQCSNKQQLQVLQRPIKPKIQPRSIIAVPIHAEKTNFVIVNTQSNSSLQTVPVAFDHTYCQS